ncbi:MAG: hypothetical protein NVSMB52_06960 [Chloroflexota bacterium]
MRIVIMGCGRTGSLLADMLGRENHQVTIIDYDDRSFTRLSDTFPGETFLGNALEQDVLRRAGLESADAFVAATSGDNRNVMAAEIALHVFEVKRVVVRIKDPNRAKIYENMGMRIDCRTLAGGKALLDLVDSVMLQEPT